MKSGNFGEKWGFGCKWGILRSKCGDFRGICENLGRNVEIMGENVGIWGGNGDLGIKMSNFRAEVQVWGETWEFESKMRNLG